jgi:LPS O-antigen subunit length determinant protein (WzzB/FepE family)
VETQELSESMEKAHEKDERKIGLTMAIVAVLLALATMLGHRTHTEEVLIQTLANDQWAYYQAKTIRSHMYGADAEMASLLPRSEALAESFKKRAEDQKTGAEQVRDQAQEKEQESARASRKANQFDTSEIFLEIAIVLCSISLLTGMRAFWLVSFGSSIVGVAFITRAFF